MVNIQKISHKLYLLIFVLLATLLASILLPFTIFAATDSDSTTIEASIASVISIATTGTVSISITPVTGGSQSSAADTVTVSTNNPTGYALTLSNSDTDTDLENGSDAIAAHDGTYAEPSALDNNTWGYAVAGGNFDASYSALDNQASSTTLWAGIPSSSSPQTIKSTNDVASSDETEIWFSVKADASNPAGTYSDTVTYTATTN